MLSKIHAFRALGEKLGTGGQPKVEEFQTLREAGFEVIINLALPTSDNALDNEGSIVTQLGMSYIQSQRLPELIFKPLALLWMLSPKGKLSFIVPQISAYPRSSIYIVS